jgi:hypothetical protein
MSHVDEQPARLGSTRTLTGRLAPLRRHSWAVTLVGVLAEVLLSLLLGRFSHHDILGLAGAGAVLVGLAVAVLAGPWAGLLTTTAGALAFWVFISDEGETAPTSATIVAAVLWGVSVFAGGAIADALRREATARRRASQESAALHQRLVLEDGGLALLIGDVSGHGPHSAALGASLRAAWRGLVQAGLDEPLMLTALSRVAVSEAAAEDLFATVWMGWLDARGTTLRMSSLGHPPPLLLADGVRYLEASPVPPLGVLPDAEWLPFEVALPEAWTLLLYTDGLVEGRAAPGESARFGPERLREWFVARRSLVVDGLTLEALMTTVQAADGGTLPDDVAVLALTRLPTGARRDT